MNPNTPQGEIRPIHAVIPYRREPIAPEDCRLGPSCLVCQWRRTGLIPPVSPHAVYPRTS